jgi:hypothetical protein
VLRQRLPSNAILSAGYDGATGELELEFQSGHVYRYMDVPPSVFDWLLRTKNKGGFVRRMITGRYVEHAVRERGEADASPGAGPSLEDVLRASLEQLKPQG